MNRIAAQTALTALGILAWAAEGLAAGEKAPADFSWRQDKASVALIGANGQVVWQLNYAEAERKPYFHPVALPGSAPLTWLTPPDHPWHYGMWFAWKYLNGKIYWEFDPKTGKEEGSTKWSNVKVTTRPDHSARLEMDLDYVPAENPKPILREKRIVEISAPAADGSYHFDWIQTFTAAEVKVEFERTPIPGQLNGVGWGGYAGLNFRFAKELKDWKVVNADNAKDMEAHGKKSAGCDFSGSMDGKEVGVAMLDHPQNSGAPTPWYVAMQPNTPMACLLTAPLFHKGRTLEAGKSFTLKNRVAIHPGRWSAERLKKECEGYGAIITIPGPGGTR
ncbi:MAG: PmoA family protein [Planctomycetes bacterium]|nr:PmoA family protein [Planctomycetota bacterium]